MSAFYEPEKIHKVILKLSGEILAGKSGFGFDMESINYIVNEIIEVKNLGLSVGIVLGGGNVFRGNSSIGEELTRFVGDNVGMLATVQNALIVSDLLKKRNYVSELFSAIQLDRVAKFYTPSRANTSLDEGKICLFCAGTGNPFFTTDTAAVLRAIELDADLVLKGTKVDGVFSTDPQKDKNATFFQNLTYDEAINKSLKIMDLTAFSLAREFSMPIKVFNTMEPGNLKRAILEKEVGTFVHK